MQQILTQLQTELEKHESISFSVLNPDVGDVYAGSTLEIEGEKYLYRGLKAWSDLAELLHCKMLVPKEGCIPLHHTYLQKAQNTKLFPFRQYRKQRRKIRCYFKLF